MRTTLFFFTLFFSFLGFSQVPQSMAYQAVVRDASDNILSDQQLGLEVNIYQNSTSGTVVFTETHTPTTNSAGLLTIQIGNGAATTGTFSTIDWSTGNYWLETKIDPSGGTNYTITGSSQLLSVPFAFHSNTTSSVTSSSSGSSSPNVTTEFLIPYMPYGGNVSQTIYLTSYFSDPSATTGSTDITIEAIDDQGISYFFGTIITITDERVSNLSGLINTAADNAGFLSGRLSLKIIASNSDFNIYPYAAYNVANSGRLDVTVIRLN